MKVIVELLGESGNTVTSTKASLSFKGDRLMNKSAIDFESIPDDCVMVEKYLVKNKFGFVMGGGYLDLTLKIGGAKSLCPFNRIYPRFAPECLSLKLLPQLPPCAS